MKIIFHIADKDLVLSKLLESGITPNKNTMLDVLYNVEAAFQQQLAQEIDHMIETFEGDK